MKRLGIVGGIAPESTIAYYRRIVAGVHERGGGYPPIVINSIDLTRMLDLIGRAALDEVTAYLAGEVERLAACGVELALFASNTPHLVFDALAARASIPLLGIVEPAAAAATRLGLTRCGVLGTRFTMQAGFYRDGFGSKGIAVVPPSAEEQERVHARYVEELVPGVFRDATRAELLDLIARFVARERLDGVLLAGTELPLLFRAETAAGVPLLDAGQLHADRAVEAMMEG
jgi:aspartate racemase